MSMQYIPIVSHKGINNFIPTDTVMVLPYVDIML